jgi:hypothetical protein
MFEPAIQNLETGETHIFRAAIFKIYLVAQPGTTDKKIPFRRADLSLHESSTIYSK